MRAVWTLAAIALVLATGYAVHSARTGVNELSWNVRTAIAFDLGKEVGALTTNDLAAIKMLRSYNDAIPLLTLPASLDRLQRFIPIKTVRITDADLVHLDKFTALQMLDLSRTKVTDAGLVHLTKISKLLSLSLSETQVTDAGLVHLEKLSALQELILSETQVTDAAMKQLREQLPNCRIIK
jgi:hypothetical protein